MADHGVNDITSGHLRRTHGFALLLFPNFLFPPTNRFIFILYFKQTFIQMSKRLKTECHAINTTQRKISKAKKVTLLRFLTSPDTHPHKICEPNSWVHWLRPVCSPGYLWQSLKLFCEKSHVQVVVPCPWMERTNKISNILEVFYVTNSLGVEEPHLKFWEIAYSLVLF